MVEERHEIVSDEREELILVNLQDEVQGFLSKAACHDGEGILHRAFSIFVFDEKQRLLLQQRSPEKRLWGGYWSNSCCSHPRRGEIPEEALHRRLKEELGLDTKLEFLFKFSYHAAFGDMGSEREVCSVWAGISSAKPRPNTAEISAWRWISAEELDTEISQKPEEFTPWFLQEWPRVRDGFLQQLP